MRRLALVGCLLALGANAQTVGGTAVVSSPSSSSSSSGSALIPGAPSVGATTAALNLFVDGANGSDSAACTASGIAACKTIQGAVNKVPKLIRHPVNISVAAGTYTAGAYVSGFSFDVGGYTPTSTLGPYLKISGTLAQASLSGAMSGSVASGTQAPEGIISGGGAGAGNPGPANWGTATVTGAGWTVNQLVGSLFCITGGTGNGECGMVSSNTATVTTIAGGWTIAAPDNTSSFQIRTWSTNVTGTLPRPPGGLQYPSSFSSSFGAAFWAVNNSAPGFRSGFGQGFGNDGAGFNTPWGNSSFTDALVTVQGFNFNVGDNGADLAASGASISDFRWNKHQSGVGVYGLGANFYAESNSLVGDAFGDPVFFSTALNAAIGGGAGYALVYGNYLTEQNSGGFNALLLAGTSALVMQNYVTAAVAGEGGVAYAGGGGMAIGLVGNSWNTAKALDDFAGEAAVGDSVIVDGDAVASSGTAFHLDNGVTLLALGDAITGSGNTLGFNVEMGSQAIFHVPESMTSTTDFHLDGTSYSLVTLRSASPKVLFNMATGSKILESP